MAHMTKAEITNRIETVRQEMNRAWTAMDRPGWDVDAILSSVDRASKLLHDTEHKLICRYAAGLADNNEYAKLTEDIRTARVLVRAVEDHALCNS